MSKQYLVTATADFTIEANSEEEAREKVESLLFKADPDAHIDSIDVQGN